MHIGRIRFRRTLLRLSIVTWRRLTRAFRLSGQLLLSEETLTETLLMAIKRAHPRVEVRAFNKREEARTGADWAWWFGSDSMGWIGFHIQAKRISFRNLVPKYPGIWRRVGKGLARPLQLDLLLDAANAEHAFPVHVFYNAWDRNSTVSLPSEWSPSRFYGCAAAFSLHVAALGRATQREDVESYVPVMTPWHRFFWPLSGTSRRRGVPIMPSGFDASGARLDEVFETFVRYESQMSDTRRGRVRIRSHLSALPSYLRRSEPGEDAPGEISADVDYAVPARILIFDLDPRGVYR